ncbi:hypothetical protein Tsp_11003 [Trichinella spiralis]|uniref:hypothetical protein n=1 Tax=Trichinella spiralis TaxID=6334 RepID=UPI0001EFC00B|nr:hypothetical protein Tsp_11003 [Trichinella spiralis]
MLIPLQIGQNCTLRVPDVDRGPADLKNFLVVVMAECEGLYTVAADLQVISENLLAIDDVPDAEIPLRTAVTKATGDQGYVKCMCLSGCSSGRCSCSRKRTSVGRLPNRLDVRGGVGEDAQKWLLEVHKTQGLTNLASEA